VTALAVGLVLGQLVAAPAAYRGAISVSDRSEIRTTRGGLYSGFDMETSPAGSVSLSSPRSSFSFGYSPRIVWFDIGGANNVTVNHAGGARYGYSARRYSVSLSVDASIGKINSLGVYAPTTLGLAPTGSNTTTPPPPPQQTPTGPDAPPPPPPTQSPGTPTNPVQFIPPPGILYTASLRFGAGFGYAISRRWNGSLNGAFTLGGGLDYESQRVVPPSRTGGLSAGFSYALNRNDALTTSVFGAYAVVLETPVPTYETRSRLYSGTFTTVGVSEGYSHSVSQRTNLSVGLGTYYAHREPNYLPASNDVNGSAFAGLGHVVPMSGGSFLGLNGAASLGAYYNPYAGTVAQTLSMSFNAGWTKRRVRAAAGLSGATEVPWDANTTRTVSGTASVGYSPTRGVAIDTGIRTSRALFPPSVAQSIPWQWSAFLSVSVVAPVMTF